jgi:hypothetical protein
MQMFTLHSNAMAFPLSVAMETLLSILSSSLISLPGINPISITPVRTELIKLSTLFSTLEATVCQYVGKCQICIKTKISSKQYGHLPKFDLLCDPWEVIQFDLFGPWTFQDITLPNHQIQGLSIIDVTTHWIDICPYSKKRWKILLF